MNHVPVPHSDIFVEECEFPWQVYISRTAKYCGGVLVHRQWIVTSAHCVYGYRGWFNPRDIEVTLGSLFVGGDVGPHVQKANVSRIVPHPTADVTFSTVPSEFKVGGIDSALLRLVRPVEITACVSTACVSDDVPVGSTCTLAGWGKTTSQLNPAKMQKAPTTVIEDCSSEMHVCTNSSESSACYGDSGGALSCQVAGIWTVAGIITDGAKGCKGLNRHILLSKLWPWIKKTISTAAITSSASHFLTSFPMLLCLLRGVLELVL